MADRATLECEISELYQQFAGGLLRYASCLAQDSDLARDAIQETFLRYFAERSYGRAIAHPRSWLFQVLRNYLLDRLGSASSRNEIRGHEMGGLADPDDDPEHKVQHSEAARDIAATLSPRERECLGLRSEGCSYEEIGGMLGLSPGTVGALLTRARGKLLSTAANGRFTDRHLAGAIHHLFQGDGLCRSI